MKYVLVTGGTGQVGIELGLYHWPEGWTAVPMSSAELDLTNPASIAEKIAERPWHAVINAGAYTAVDKAEVDVEKAWRVNAVGVAILAVACRDAGIPLIQISTDYVFAGDRPGPWETDDPTGPLGVYGASKLGGELAVATSGARYAIVRTAWVVSPHGSNFVKTMLRLAAEHRSLNVVADQHGSPTGAADLAAALATIAVRLSADTTLASGIYHFSGAGRTSWAEFARAIFAGAAARGAAASDVNDIATSEYPTLARRPANSVLSHRAIERDFAISPRPWRDTLDEILDQLIGKA